MPQNVKNMNKKSLPRIKATKPIDTDGDSEENVVETLSPVLNSNKEKFSLYVRGAAWIKDRENALNRFKEIEPKIHEVRHPRQKSADFCFIDFVSALDRDQSYENLRNHSDVKVRHVTTDVPKMVNKRQKQIAERREAKHETRKLIRKIKLKEKLNANITEKTNQVAIVNLPRQVTVAELKQQFPNAVRVNVKKHPKVQKLQSAIITFPDPKSAFMASRESINLHGQKINIMLNKEDSFKGKSKSKKTEKRSKPTTSQLEMDDQSPQKIIKLETN